LILRKKQLDRERVLADQKRQLELLREQQKSMVSEICISFKKTMYTLHSIK